MLHAVDLIVLGGYVLVVVSLGWIAHRRQSSTDDFFLGGRRLPSGCRT